MKTTLMTALLLCAFALAGWSQTADADVNPKDPKAKAILDKLRGEFESYTSIQYDFKYTLKGDGIDETQQGTILLKGNKYKLNIAEAEIVSNGTHIYLMRNQEMQINNLDGESEEFMSPTKLLTVYENEMKYRVDGTSASAEGKSGTLIKLHPMDAKSRNFHTMEVLVEEATNKLLEMRVRSKNGTVYIYTLINMKSNVAAPDSMFQIDPDADQWEDWDIIDLTEG